LDLCSGGVHGLYQILGEILEPVKSRIIKVLHVDVNTYAHKLFRVLVTFVLVDVAWVFFRAASLSEALLVFKQIVSELNVEIFWNGELYALGLSQAEFSFLCLAIGVLWLVSYLRNRVSLIGELEKQHVIFRWFVYLGLIYSIVGILLIQGFGFASQEFIYFQF